MRAGDAARGLRLGQGELAGGLPKMALRNDGTIHRFVADRRLLGLLASVAAATVSFTSSDFDPERGLSLRVGFTSDFPSASAGGDTVGVAAEATSAAGLRPRPSSFASDDRRSE